MLDVDATVVGKHSEKVHAVATCKRTFEYHQIGVWCDSTGEFLAAILRPGKAGSNTAADAELTGFFAPGCTPSASRSWWAWPWWPMAPARSAGWT